MKFYAPFCLPFLVGALVMAAVIAWKYVVWFAELPRADKKRVLFGIPTPRTLGAVGEVIGECLLQPNSPDLDGDMYIMPVSWAADADFAGDIIS